jgi:cytoskeleton protein RodZ
MSEKPTGVAEEPPAGESFGTWLRQQREMREIHLSEISDRTKISLRYLRAMEQDNFELLPGLIFVKGFLREYAKYVGLNPDEVVNFYLSTHAEPENTGELEEEPPVPSHPLGRGLLLAVLGILLLALVTYFLFSYLGREREQTSETAPPFGAPLAPVPVQEGGAAEPRPAIEGGATEPVPLTVTLDFSEDCWVEVVVDGGEERVDRRFVQGESLTLPARESVVFQTLGNARGVSVQVNGHPFPLATSGRVLRDLRIDLDTVRRLSGDPATGGASAPGVGGDTGETGP